MECAASHMKRHETSGDCLASLPWKARRAAGRWPQRQQVGLLWALLAPLLGAESKREGVLAADAVPGAMCAQSQNPAA